MNVRDEFEKWYLGDQDVALLRNGEGYKYASVQSSWLAFKAGCKAYDKCVTDRFDCVAQVNSAMGGIEWFSLPLEDNTNLYILKDGP